MLSSRLMFAALAASCFTPIVSAQLVWSPQLGAPFPIARHESALAFDPVGGGLVLFGGSTNLPVDPNDTWRWTGGVWQQLNPVAAPPARYGPRLATDTARNAVVLFGGVAFNFALPQIMVSLNDTWEWNGSNWIQRFPSTNPPPRSGHALAYDAGRGVTVMFGGFDITAATSTYFADTWEWDGVNWTLRVPTTPMSPLTNHSMAYDAARGVVVMADGIGPSRGTWEWNGVAWTPRGPCPTGYGARLAYDGARNRVVWYGGADNQGYALPIGVWEWDGLAWTQRAIAVSPPPRFWHMMAFEPVTEQIVVFGGRDDSQPSLQQRKGDTWTLGPVYRATTTPFGVACGGAAGPLTIATADRPWLGTTLTVDWTNTPAGSVVLLAFGWSRQVWLGVPLPLPLGAIGMPGCSLLVSLDYFEARATMGSTLQQLVVLPYVAAVLGLELSLQGFGLDPAANPAGITASNGIALRLGGL
ncbi:MAG TPA: hypothetical protein VFD82_17220 [Planctomycetota bacterium]|nr:hypothetical protein [Planctomycetota bacterium]